MCDNMCDLIVEVVTMATNLQVDDQLIIQAVKLGGHKTKKAAVTQALIEYITHLEQEKVLSMFGKVDYDPEYDYKKQRAQP
jgi:Arc/MetJ family transcription regulator